MKWNQMMNGGSWAGALVLLMGIGLLVAGCESDPVAPQDTLPELTEGEVAQQAALVAVGIAQAGPKMLTYDGTKSGPAELGVYPYSFPSEGNISGIIVLEYFTGGSEGVHSNWDDADYGKLYTPEGENVTVALDLGGGVEPIFSVTFDLFGPIDRPADTATVSGSGTFTTQEFVRSFTLTDVILTEVSSYPSGGTMDYTSGSIDLTVTYDGSRYVSADIDGGGAFVIDLDTGLSSPAGDE
jgi:hypothetical protein